MGLDITAHSKLQREEDQTKDRDDYEIKVWHNDSFPGRCDDIAEGYYTSAGEEVDFRAGSYSSYNHWRNELAKLAGYESASAVWSKIAVGPFIELIDFSDCEGAIGTAVSAKLAKDFAEHQPKADAHPDERFRELYATWRKAFELASDAGAVQFH
jgi:hypothetical protein